MDLYRFIIASLVILTPGPALAHHTVSELGIAWTEPVSHAEARLESARYDLSPDSGHFGLLNLAGEWAPHRLVSFGGQVPVAFVRPASGAAEVGISDIVLSARGLLVATDHGELLLSGGVAAELPTGSEAAGLGGGHLELAPFLTFSSTLGTRALILHGVWADGFAVGAHESDPGHAEDAHDHSHSSAVGGSVIAPHTTHEASFRHGLTLAYLGPFFVGVRNEVVLKWVGDDVLGPVTAGAELGWNPGDAWRVSMAADIPVTLERRYSWRASIGTAVRF